jgi:hypothetical protein
MNGNVMERLARANPVRELPAVEPVARVQELLESESESGAPGPPSHRRPWRGLAGAGALVAAVCAAVLALTAGSPSPRVDVLAEVYAATAPKPGIVESVTVTRTFRGPGKGTSVTLREWDEPSAQRRRGFSVARSLHGGGALTRADKLYSPATWEAWSSNGKPEGLRPLGGAHPAADVVYRIDWNSGYRPDSKRMGFLGSGLVGSQFRQFYEALYRHAGWRVAGRERRDGRLLWRLEEAPQKARARVREDSTRFYVLVDAHSFLPVYERLIYLTPAGPRTISESELVGYRTLLASVNPGLFDLAAQHRGAKVVLQHVAPPRA